MTMTMMVMRMAMVIMMVMVMIMAMVMRMAMVMVIMMSGSTAPSWLELSRSHPLMLPAGYEDVVNKGDDGDVYVDEVDDDHS